MSLHPEQELAAAWALGSLGDDERAAFAAHLAGCAECRTGVSQFEDVTGLLALAAPAANPPAGLRERVMAEARRVRPFPVRRTAPAAWLAAAAVLIALVATGQAWRATARSRNLQSELSAARAALAGSDSTLRSLMGSQLHMVALAAPTRQPVARIFWNHERSVFVVTAFGLPRAAGGRTWQLWAIADGHAPVSMGTFDTDAGGAVTAVLRVSPEVLALGTVRLCALTEEPAGGSPQPTEQPRLVGAWIHTE